MDRACPPRKKLKGENAPLYDNKRTVFVGNLPFDVKVSSCVQYFFMWTPICICCLPSIIVIWMFVSLSVQDEEIYQLFCGLNNLESSVEAVRVIRHSHMRVGKGIAYVLFKTRV